MNLAARNGKINSIIHVLAWLHFINTHIQKKCPKQYAWVLTENMSLLSCWALMKPNIIFVENCIFATKSAWKAFYWFRQCIVTQSRLMEIKHKSHEGQPAADASVISKLQVARQRQRQQV